MVVSGLEDALVSVQPQQQQQQQQQPPAPPHASATASAAAASPRPQHLPNASSTQQTTANSGKRASRRSSSGRHSSNNEAPTSSQSAPGSPKLEGKKPTAAVLNHFQALPEAPELKSGSHDQPHVGGQKLGSRQCSNDEGNEHERMAQPTASSNLGTVINGANVYADYIGYNGTSRHHNFATTSAFATNVASTATTSNSGVAAAAAAAAVAAAASGGSRVESGISPAVVAAVAAAGYDTESDIEQHHQTSSNRSRQKKFLKNFKQLPTEEVVLQRYSCALVSDILLQGHLYITENYFAFHSNVFGYVTRLQIPVRSVTKITKEKTAKIIPNAVGVCTEDNVKHIFASLLSRDTTFKLMTRLWKRAIREAGRIEEDLMLPDTCDAPETGELDDIINDDESSDSEEHLAKPEAMVDPMEQSYVVKRTLFPSTSSVSATATGGSGNIPRGADSISAGHNEINVRRGSILSTATTGDFRGGGGGILGHVSRSTVLSVFVVVLLIFLFCSSMYLVFRVDSLQRQVESRYPYKIPGDWPRMGSQSSEESPEKIQKVLDDNVEQISSVRKSLEKLSNLIQTEDLSYSTRDET